MVMKNRTVLLLLLWGSIQIASPSFADTAGSVAAKRQPSITVTGTGKVLQKPDMARVNVGVVTQSTTAAEALQRNTEAAERLMAALEKHGVAEKDIQTSNFGIAPEYDYTRSNQPPRLTGYRVTNQLRIAVRRIADLGELLDEVVSAGANQINGVTFEIADAESIQDSARRLAVRDARRKADLYAQEAGIRLGPVLELVETAGAVPMPQFGIAMAQESRAVPIAAGELTLRQDVRVTFAVGPKP
jgi:uncharacterized protein YggE